MRKAFLRAFGANKENHKGMDVANLSGTEKSQEVVFDFLMEYTPEELRKERKLKNLALSLQLANVAAVVFIMFFVFLMTLILDHPKISEIEQRTLASFPKFSASAFFSGEFTDGVAQYINDTMPYRDSFKNMTANLQKCMGIRLDDGVTIHGQVSMISSEDFEDAEEGDVTDVPAVTVPITTNPVTTASVSGSQPTVTTPAPAVTPGSKTTTAPKSTTESEKTTKKTEAAVGGDEGIITNGILVINNRGIMLYGGGFSAGKRYAGYVNAFKKDLGDKVNVYSMVIPTSVAYYLPKKYEGYTASEKKNIDNIKQYLVGVTDVDSYTALGKHTAENIYTRTDHHWAGLGAYYAAQEFAKTAVVPFDDLSTFTPVTIPNYVGTLYGYTGDAALKNNPEDFIYYVPKNTPTVTYYNQKYGYVRTGGLFSKGITGTSTYCTYLGGDGNVVHIETGVGNGRKLMIIKDSYGNALPSFLTSSFEDIYVCDMRYFEVNVVKFAKEKGVTDLLFASCAFSATGANSKHLEVLRTQ